MNRETRRFQQTVSHFTSCFEASLMDETVQTESINLKYELSSNRVAVS